MARMKSSGLVERVEDLVPCHGDRLGPRIASLDLDEPQPAAVRDVALDVVAQPLQLTIRRLEAEGALDRHHRRPHACGAFLAVDGRYADRGRPPGRRGDEPRRDHEHAAEQARELSPLRVAALLPDTEREGLQLREGLDFRLQLGNRPGGGRLVQKARLGCLDLVRAPGAGSPTAPASGAATGRSPRATTPAAAAESSGRSRRCRPVSRWRAPRRD